MLRNSLEQRLPDSVNRIWELPPIALQGPSEDYVGLMKEARELFVAGYFYSLRRDVRHRWRAAY